MSATSTEDIAGAVRPARERKLSKRRKPSKAALARAKTARAVMPYAAGAGAAAVAGLVLDTALLPVAGASMAVALAARQGHEHIHWRSQGGKAAQRKRDRYQGEATAREIRRALSPAAARRRARITRPSLHGIRPPVSETGIGFGTSVNGGRKLVGSFEDFIAYFGMARSGKSGAMARNLHDFPGAALSTSTRTDMWANTIHARRELASAHGGRVWTLNPGRDGGIPSDFACDPLTGCQNLQLAMEAAGYLMAATPKDPGGRDAWIDEQGAHLLGVVMHAAAIAGGNMLTVQEWVRHPGNSDLRSVLGTGHAAPGAAPALAAVLGAKGGNYLQSVSVTTAAALSWLINPAMERAACPPPGEGIDVWEFMETRSTAYLIGTDKPSNALTRYFAWFAAHLFDNAKRHASMQPGGRLDPPLGLVIDEPALTCPVPLDKWSPEGGGHGITLITGFQSFAQLTQRWGDGGQVMLDNAVKIMFGGYTASTHVEQISAACDEEDTWHHVTAADGSRTMQPAKQRVFPHARLKALEGSTKPGQDPKAVVLYRWVRPFEAAVPSVWRLPGFRRATTGHDRAPEPERMPLAIETAPVNEIEAPAGAGKTWS